jgi:hypothetical protein
MIDEGRYCLTIEAYWSLFYVSSAATPKISHSAYRYTFVLCKFLTINTRYFPTQLSPTGLRSGDGIFFFVVVAEQDINIVYNLD